MTHNAIVEDALTNDSFSLEVVLSGESGERVLVFPFASRLIHGDHITVGFSAAQFLPSLDLGTIEPNARFQWNSSSLLFRGIQITPIGTYVVEAGDLLANGEIPDPTPPWDQAAFFVVTPHSLQRAVKQTNEADA